MSIECRASKTHTQQQPTECAMLAVYKPLSLCACAFVCVSVCGRVFVSHALCIMCAVTNKFPCKQVILTAWVEEPATATTTTTTVLKIICTYLKTAIARTQNSQTPVCGIQYAKYSTDSLDSENSVWKSSARTETEETHTDRENHSHRQYNTKQMPAVYINTLGQHTYKRTGTSNSRCCRCRYSCICAIYSCALREILKDKLRDLPVVLQSIVTVGFGPC